MRQNYENRLRVLLSGDHTRRLFTSTGLLVASGLARVVIGGRGPYVEFDDSQVVMASLRPAPVRHYYYDEWRTVDQANLKFYHQRAVVDYADYRIGMWYATPFELFDESGVALIEPVRKQASPTLFD
jgi:hypothetical protein